MTNKNLNQTQNDPIFSVYDILAYLIKRKKIFLIFSCLGTLIALTAFTLAPKNYEHEINLDINKGNGLVLNTTDEIHSAFISALSQSNLSLSFSKEFYRFLKNEAITNNEQGLQAKLALEYFNKQFNKNMSDESAINPRKNTANFDHLSFADYLKTKVVTALRDNKLPKNGFLYFISNLENTSWKIVLRSSEKDIIAPIARASSSALNKVVSDYNNKEIEKREDISKDRLKKAQELFSSKQKEFLQLKSPFELEKTNLKIEFYRLENEVNKLYLTHLKFLKKNGEATKIPSIFSNALEDNRSIMTLLSSEGSIKELNSELISKRLAEIVQNKNFDALTIQTLTDKLSTIETKKSETKSKIEAFETGFNVSKEALNKALSSSIEPVRTETFALPSSTYDNDLLEQQAKNVFKPRVFQEMILWLLMGLICSFFIAFIFVLCIEFKKTAPFLIAKSRFSKKECDPIKEPS